MTEKLLECCELCMGNGWVLDMHQEQYQCPKCKGSGKPCTIANKPDASPDRLLTDEEINTQFVLLGINQIADWELVKEAIKNCIREQKDLTYPLAFEAGKKAQKEEDRQEIAAIKAMWQEDIEKLKTQLDTANNCLNFANDSNLKGREEMYQLQATHKAELERVFQEIEGFCPIIKEGMYGKLLKALKKSRLEGK